MKTRHEKGYIKKRNVNPRGRNAKLIHAHDSKSGRSHMSLDGNEPTSYLNNCLTCTFICVVIQQLKLLQGNLITRLMRNDGKWRITRVDRGQ